MDNPWKDVTPEEAYAEAERRIAVARETDATLLDLGDLPLHTIPPQLGELTWLEVLSLGRELPIIDEDGKVQFVWSRGRCAYQGDEFSSLTSLESLQYLDLNGVLKLENLNPLSRLVRLRWLGLSQCGNISDLSPLSAAKYLSYLDLYACVKIQDVWGLCELRNLETLDLQYSGLNSIDSIVPLLDSLRDLKLYGCNLSGDSEQLASRFTNRNAIDLIRSHFGLPTRAPDGISNPMMSAEKAIEEAENRIQAVRSNGGEQLILGDLPLLTLPDSLRNLPQLKRLSLGKIEGQMPDFLDNLTWFDERCSFQGSDLTQLGSLQALESLDLSGCSNVKSLAVLSELVELRQLSLDECGGVTDLGPLSRLSQLQALSLFGCCQVRDLEPLRHLSNIESLNLEHSRCDSFEFVRGLLKTLRSLKLHGSKFEELESVLKGESSENVIDRVRAHFDDLAAGAAEEAEVKVFVLGNGMVGKTQLVRQVMGDEFDKNLPSTHGIQCRHREETNLARWKKVRFNFWDFGGQDIYHGSHSLFLHGEAIFLLLWTPDKEDGEWDEAGVKMRNRPLSYWLDYVRSLAGPKAPVLVIQSWCDTPGLKQKPPIPVEHDFEYLKDFTFSAKCMTDVMEEDLKTNLRQAAARILSAHRMQIGKGRAEVRQVIRNMLEQDQELPKDQRRHRTIPIEKYEKVCSDVTAKIDPKTGQGYVVSNPTALLDYLNKTGVVLYDPKRFGGRIVLDQEWALEAIYAIFHRAETHNHLVNAAQGRFTQKLLHELIWGRTVDGKGPYSIADQKLFLEMMQTCGICFRANSHDEGEAIYIAPELLPDGKTITARYAWLEEEPHKSGVTSAILRYRFLHEGIIRGLISKIGAQACEGAEYAKRACYFYDRRTESNVLIESAWELAPKESGRGELRFRAWGKRPRQLVDTLLRIVPKLTVDEPNRELSWNVPNRPTGPRESMSHDDAVKQIDPVKVKVYLSYAWGDETELRQKAADKIVTDLRKAGYEPIFDKQKMKPGDRISDFMNEIACGQKVVVIVSDKYLRSRFCVKELYLIDLRELHNAEMFHKKVIPIVLADAAIDDARARLERMDYWRNKYKELAEDYSRLAKLDQNQCDEIAQWIPEFGNILVKIKDQLSPQNVDELDKIDFKHIRQRLDWR